MKTINLEPQDVYEVLCQTLPKQNDFAFSDYKEELQELIDFNITSKILLLDLIVKHRDDVLNIDKEPLDDFHVKHYKSEYGRGYVEDRITNNFWFAYPALLRIILELEFGESYIDYSNKRDII